MITYKEIAFIAYPSTDIERSRKFYEGVLLLTPTSPVKQDANWIEYNVGTGTLAIGKSSSWAPSKDGPSACLEVEDFESAANTMRQQNIEFIAGPLETPVCHMFTIRDPDGNKITLHRRKNG